MKDMEDIKIAREETDLEWRPVLDGVHAYADLRRLGRRLAAERHVTDETIACLTGELERAIADVGKLTREQSRQRDRLATIIDEAWGMHPYMPTDALLTELERRLHADHRERERLRRALERAERALQGIATAQRFDRNVFSDDSAYVDWARSLSLHVAEIARAALAGEGEGASDASDA